MTSSLSKLSHQHGRSLVAPDIAASPLEHTRASVLHVAMRHIARTTGVIARATIKLISVEDLGLCAATHTLLS